MRLHKMLRSHASSGSADRAPSPDPEAPLISTLIDQARNGSSAAPVEVYVRIDAFIGDRTSAQQLLQGEVPPAEIIRETYLALTAPKERTDVRRAYFFAIGATAIRRHLADHAQTTDQRSPEDARPLSSSAVDALLAPDAPLSALPAEAIHVFDAALSQLEGDHPLQAQIIECRLFGGMPVDTIAAALDRSPNTVQAEEAAARAWLHQHLNRAAE